MLSKEIRRSDYISSRYLQLVQTDKTLTEGWQMRLRIPVVTWTRFSPLSPTAATIDLPFQEAIVSWRRWDRQV
jgi:hypothetical protein